MIHVCKYSLFSLRQNLDYNKTGSLTIIDKLFWLWLWLDWSRTHINLNLWTVYKIQDILFPNHGPHKGIISTNIQRKNHNYIEYNYTMTYLSQHIKSNIIIYQIYIALFSYIKYTFKSAVQTTYNRYGHTIQHV
jgi:hypothetical protein